MTHVTKQYTEALSTLIAEIGWAVRVLESLEPNECVTDDKKSQYTTAERFHPSAINPNRLKNALAVILDNPQLAFRAFIPTMTDAHLGKPVYMVTFAQNAFHVTSVYIRWSNNINFQKTDAYALAVELSNARSPSIKETQASTPVPVRIHESLESMIQRGAVFFHDHAWARAYAEHMTMKLLKGELP